MRILMMLQSGSSNCTWRVNVSTNVSVSVNLQVIEGNFNYASSHVLWLYEFGIGLTF